MKTRLTYVQRAALRAQQVAEYRKRHADKIRRLRSLPIGEHDLEQLNGGIWNLSELQHAAQVLTERRRGRFTLEQSSDPETRCGGRFTRHA